MKKTGSVLKQAGFTLIEILVALILISLLVAAVFPVVSQQISQADAPRTGNDLASIRSGLQNFLVNMRGQFPGDLEDLVFAPTATTDSTVSTGTYQNVTRWNGPYADFTLTEGTAVKTAAFATGFNATVNADLTCFNAGTNAVAADLGSACLAGHFVAVKVLGLDTTAFKKLDVLLDGSDQSTAYSTLKAAGKLRCVTETGSACDTTFFLAVPWRS